MGCLDERMGPQNHGNPGQEKGLAGNDKNEELIVKVGSEPKSPNLSFCTVPSHITSDEQSPRISLGRGEYRQALQKIAFFFPPKSQGIQTHLPKALCYWAPS